MRAGLDVNVYVTSLDEASLDVAGLDKVYKDEKLIWNWNWVGQFSTWNFQFPQNKSCE